jgi:hypothetical protein
MGMGMDKGKGKEMNYARALLFFWLVSISATNRINQLLIKQVLGNPNKSLQFGYS